MRYFQVDVRKKPTEYGFMPTMQLYLVEGSKERRPVVLIAPGGGYTTLCLDSDGDRVAMQYNAAGFHAAVLGYSVEPHGFPEPQRDMLLAIRMLRENAKEWGIREDAIAICGFSAGGHLCGSVSTLWPWAGEDGRIDCRKVAAAQKCLGSAAQCPDITAQKCPGAAAQCPDTTLQKCLDTAAQGCQDNTMQEVRTARYGKEEPGTGTAALYRPNAAILCYAILTTRLAHCRDFLKGHAGCDEEKLQLAACDMQVGGHTPPTFLYGTFEDKLTNVENILYYSEQLSKYDVPFESHIFPKGGHGAPWCDDTIWAKPARGRDYNYIRLSVEWMRELFGLL